MVLVIFVFSVSEDLVVFVTLRTANTERRCHPNKGQLSVAIQRAAVPCKQGATFRCHVALFEKGANLPPNPRLCVSRVGSVLVKHWPFAKIIFENFYWSWLPFSNIVPSFPKTGPFLGPKIGKFSVLIAWLAWFQIRKLTKNVNLTFILV